MKFYQSTSADILNKIKELSSSYVPEWVLDEENPDASAAIAHIFADFMGQEIDYFNLYPERFRIEFVNMYGISRRGAKPSHSVVAFKSGVSNADVKIPGGTELLASPSEDDENGDDIVFKTLNDIAVTDVDVNRIISVSPIHETIIDSSDVNDEEITLFGYKGKNLYKNRLIIDAASEQLCDEKIIKLRFKGNKESRVLAEILAGSCFDYSFVCQGKEIEAVAVRQIDDRIEVYKGFDERIEQIIISAVKDNGENIAIREIEIIPNDKKSQPECILHDGMELDAKEFAPFGNKLEEFSECYICGDSIFKQKGAEALISFELQLAENVFTNEIPEETGTLPLVKRKEKESLYKRVMSDSYIQEVSFEYFNGIGWKALNTDESVINMFSADASLGNKAIHFKIPYDWLQSTEGGYSGRSIRIRIRRADNCYMTPCTHHYPVMYNLKIAYSYKDSWLHPESVVVENNRRRENITHKLSGDEDLLVFEDFPYHNNEVYLELTGKFRRGPIGIFFELSDSVHFEGTSLSFFYSSMKGFKPLYVIDNTDGFTKSGTILFEPPTDMAKVLIFDEEHCYIRIVDNYGRYDSDKAFRPRLKRVIMNAIEVANIVENPPESFYIEEVRHNMTFQLPAGYILYADVWVNEMGNITYAEMDSLMEDCPEKIRVERDIRGEISDFFVKWREVADFEDKDSGDGRIYRIDRIDNRISFGDGVNQKIPKNTQSTAFIVTLYTSDGTRANLQAESIKNLRRNLLFVDDIIHPIATYGGNSFETVQAACRRAAAVISSRERLITEEDIVNEALAFSENINQAVCVFDEKGFQLVLLMKDYLNGPFSLRMIKSAMKEDFIKKLPLTMDKDKFDIVEPLFVEVSLDIWLTPNEKGKEFEIEEYWLKKVTDFLNPLVGDKSLGWPIGTLPTEKQFNMLFNDTENLSIISNYQVTAAYSDENGVHACELSKLYGNPRVVPVNGTHNIHMKWK
ncbi:hypothetical protein SAMN05216390_10552 [Lachnospiraceae bacterium KH1T2]|nr:hypothetical protein SAMN05216390_10552 [Lachnospiraceae bacterium KH1T2]